MGKEFMHVQNHYILYHEYTFKDLDKCPVYSASRYKDNVCYYGGNNQGLADRNKRKGKGVRNSVASVEPDTLGIF